MILAEVGHLRRDPSPKTIALVPLDRRGLGAPSLGPELNLHLRMGAKIRVPRWIGRGAAHRRHDEHVATVEEGHDRYGALLARLFSHCREQDEFAPSQRGAEAAPGALVERDVPFHE